jgi:hypothetical protein
MPLLLARTRMRVRRQACKTVWHTHEEFVLDDARANRIVHIVLTRTRTRTRNAHTRTHTRRCACQQKRAYVLKARQVLKGKGRIGSRSFSTCVHARSFRTCVHARSFSTCVHARSFSTCDHVRSFSTCDHAWSFSTCVHAIPHAYIPAASMRTHMWALCMRVRVRGRDTLKLTPGQTL